MEKSYYVNNRKRLYQHMDAGSLLAIFSGEELWKCGDEYFPFFADRNFVYLTGLKCKSAVLLAAKDSDGSVQGRLYLLPPDALAERAEHYRPQLEAYSLALAQVIGKPVKEKILYFLRRGEQIIL